jgi:hypothetical protein
MKRESFGRSVSGSSGALFMAMTPEALAQPSGPAQVERLAGPLATTCRGSMALLPRMRHDVRNFCALSLD